MKTNSFVDEGMSSVQHSVAAQVNPPTAVDTSSWFDDPEGPGTSTAVPRKKQFARGRQKTLGAGDRKVPSSWKHKAWWAFSNYFKSFIFWLEVWSLGESSNCCGHLQLVQPSTSQQSREDWRADKPSSSSGRRRCLEKRKTWGGLESGEYLTHSTIVQNMSNLRHENKQFCWWRHEFSPAQCGSPGESTNSRGHLELVWWPGGWWHVYSCSLEKAICKGVRKRHLGPGTEKFLLHENTKLGEPSEIISRVSFFGLKSEA